MGMLAKKPSTRRPRRAALLAGHAGRQLHPQVGEEAAADDDDDHVDERGPGRARSAGQHTAAGQPVGEQQDDAADGGHGHVGEHRPDDRRRGVARLAPADLQLGPPLDSLARRGARPGSGVASRRGASVHAGHASSSAVRRPADDRQRRPAWQRLGRVRGQLGDTLRRSGPARSPGSRRPTLARMTSASLSASTMAKTLRESSSAACSASQPAMRKAMHGAVCLRASTQLDPVDAGEVLVERPASATGPRDGPRQLHVHQQPADAAGQRQQRAHGANGAVASRSHSGSSSPRSGASQAQRQRLRAQQPAMAVGDDGSRPPSRRRQWAGRRRSGWHRRAVAHPTCGPHPPLAPGRSVGRSASTCAIATRATSAARMRGAAGTHLDLGVERLRPRLEWPRRWCVSSPSSDDHARWLDPVPHSSTSRAMSRAASAAPWVSTIRSGDALSTAAATARASRSRWSRSSPRSGPTRPMRSSISSDSWTAAIVSAGMGPAACVTR